MAKSYIPFWKEGEISMRNLSLKNILIGSIVIFVLTALIQRIIFNIFEFTKNNILTDLFIWIIVYMALTGISFFINFKLQSHKKLHLILAFVAATVVLFAILFFTNTIHKQIQFSNYQNTLKSIEEKDIQEIERMMTNQEDFIFFLTSETCPYCIKFLPSIRNDIEEYDDMPIYYVQKENDIEATLKNIFSIKSIPYLVKIQNGEINQNYFDNPINFF